MGFLDHLFKLKQSDEKMGDGEKGAGGNGEHPAALPDPGAFLHPKDFGARGGGLHSPVRPAAQVTKTPPSETRNHEIVLTLGDVLSRIPTQFLRAGMHDAGRELRFAVDDLSADIARGRAAVPLSKIAALCPDVFAREIAPGDDSDIRLPLQKLVEQIGLLRGRPAAPETPPAKDSQPPAAEPAAEPASAAPLENPEGSEAGTGRDLSGAPPSPCGQPHSAEAAPEEGATAGAQGFQQPPEGGRAPLLHIHPPPVVRPILVHPPTLLTERDRPQAPPAPGIPDPPMGTAHAPDQPPPFPQEALQAIFMTDETLDLAAVVRLAAALPGVRACVGEWRGESALAGDAPDGFSLTAIKAAADPQRATGALPIGTLENLTLHGDQASISIFARPCALLAVLHRALPPGVRERLAAITAELARA